MPNFMELEMDKKNDIGINDNVKLVKDMIDKGRGEFVLENIDRLGIQASRDKLEIAKKLLPKYSDVVISHINKFDITDEKDRLELIEACIAKNPRAVIANLDKLNINNSNFALEVARKFVISGSVQAVIRNLDKFNIENSSDRFKLAKQLSNTVAYSGILIDNIHKFKIEDPKDRMELIERIIKDGRNDYRLIINIDKFDIPDEKDRVAIVKKLIPNSTDFIARNIEKFRLQEASDMFDISKMVIEEFSKKMFLSPFFYGEANAMLVDSTQNACEGIFNKAYNLLKPTDDLHNEIGVCGEKIANIEKLNSFHKSGRSNINFAMKLGKENEDKINDVISSIKEERRKADAREIVERVLFLRENLDLKLEKNDALTKLMEELITVRNPDLKEALIPLMSKFIVDNKFDIIEDEMKNNDKKKAYPAINAMVFDKLSLYDDNNKDILDSIRKAFSKNSFLKNSKEVQETMMSLSKLEDLKLTDEVKRGVLKFLLKHPNDINQNCRYIMSIVSLKDKEQLSGIDENKAQDTLKDTFYDVYKQFVNFDDEKLKKEYEQFVNREDNLNKKLEERIVVYLSRHKDDEQLRDLIEKFVKTMADGKKFREERYSTKLSEHLKEISDIDSDVYKKWCGLQDKFKPIDGQNRAFITDDPVDLLLTGTDVDGSCQHIEHGSKNRCLMGYVMDGKNKAIVIKNNEGRMIARSIVRLLIDEDTNSIVMTKERLYKANGVSEKINDELEDMCVEYAKWLGVPLVCEKEFEKMAQDMEVFNKYNSKEEYKGTLVSKSSVAPYEYTDMGLGDIEDGYFGIDDRDLVYLYKKG